MHGLLQTSFFFGYNAVVCFAFFLMLGSVGWRASLLFVRSIYKVRAGQAGAPTDVGCACTIRCGSHPKEPLQHPCQSAWARV